MKSEEALASEQALEAKFSEMGFGKDRIDVRQEAAPEAITLHPEGTPAVETPQAEPLRDEQGRFAAAEQPETEAPPVESVQAESAPDAEIDPYDPQAVQKYLNKYGGDKDKAIAAAVHAQTLAARQANELGEARRENEQYQAMLAELQGLRSDFQQARTQQPIDQGTADWFDQQVMNNPQQALEWARQQNNQILMQRGLDTWKEYDPYGAASYRNDLQLAALQQQLEQRQVQQTQLPKDAAVNLALQNVRSRHPEFSSFDEALGATLERNPWLQTQLKNAADSGDPSQLEGVIETAYGLTRGDTLYQALQSGDTPEDTTTTSEVVAPTVSEELGQEPEVLTPTQQMKAEMHAEMEKRRRGVFVAE